MPGGRSTAAARTRGLRCHTVDIDAAPSEIDGVTVTSLQRTLLDVATQPSVTRAVAMVDAGIRFSEQGDFLHDLGMVPPTREVLLRLHEARLPYFASARAGRALEFLLAEKHRVDRMRRVVKRFARPPKGVIRDRDRLRSFLARHGLVPGWV